MRLNRNHDKSEEIQARPDDYDDSYHFSISKSDGNIPHAHSSCPNPLAMLWSAPSRACDKQLLYIKLKMGSRRRIKKKGMFHSNS